MTHIDAVATKRQRERLKLQNVLKVRVHRGGRNICEEIKDAVKPKVTRNSLALVIIRERCGSVITYLPSKLSIFFPSFHHRRRRNVKPPPLCTETFSTSYLLVCNDPGPILCAPETLRKVRFDGKWKPGKCIGHQLVRNERDT